jgi:hypothetical protein
MKPDYVKLIAELREYDHLFLSPEGAKHFTAPFGFKAHTYTMKANPNEFKGLTLNNGATEAEGVEADVLAMQICRHLLIPFPSKFGRGSQLRACCDALEAWALAGKRN